MASSNVIQKRYRFSLDLAQPEEKALAGYLEMLESMTIKERGAWVTRALVYYHDAMVLGQISIEDPKVHHQALIAQALAVREGYTPPDDSRPEPRAPSVALTTPGGEESVEGVVHILDSNGEVADPAPASSESNQSRDLEPSKSGVTPESNGVQSVELASKPEPSPFKKRLASLMAE